MDNIYSIGKVHKNTNVRRQNGGKGRRDRSVTKAIKRRPRSENLILEKFLNEEFRKNLFDKIHEYLFDEIAKNPEEYSLIFVDKVGHISQVNAFNEHQIIEKLRNFLMQKLFEELKEQFKSPEINDREFLDKLKFVSKNLARFVVYEVANKLRVHKTGIKEEELKKILNEVNDNIGRRPEKGVYALLFRP